MTPVLPVVATVLLVGELNPFGADPYYALYFLPRTSSGNRLRRILGLSDVDYMRRCSRVNLCDRRWDLKAARDRVALLLAERSETVFVMLGAKVRQAANHLPASPFTMFSLCLASGGRRHLVSLPHPSGLCREWDKPGAVERARELLRQVAPEVPWGMASDALAGT